MENKITTTNKMAHNPTKASTDMLPVMAVLGIMFIGICIAMNLFSRARFKKRANAFTAAGRINAQRRSNRGPGGSHRMSYCPSQQLQHHQQQLAKLSQVAHASSRGSVINNSGRQSVITSDQNL